MRYDKDYLRRKAAYELLAPVLRAGHRGSGDPRYSVLKEQLEVLHKRLEGTASESTSMLAHEIDTAFRLACQLAELDNDELQRLARDPESVNQLIYVLFPNADDVLPLTSLHEWREVWVQKDGRERSRKSIAIALALLSILAVAPVPIRITIAGCALTTLLTIRVLIEAEIGVATSNLRGRISLLQELSQLSLRRVALALGGIVAETCKASTAKPRPRD